MLPEQFIYETLSNDADITNLVSDRIYPVIPEQDVELPFIVYMRTATEVDRCLDGTIETIAEFEITYWGVNFQDVESIGEKVLEALDGATDENLCAVYVNQFQHEEFQGYHQTQNYRVMDT